MFFIAGGAIIGNSALLTLRKESSGTATDEKGVAVLNHPNESEH
jgi:hypothetical protein